MQQKSVQKHIEKIKLYEESIKSEYTRKARLVYFKKYTDYLGPKFDLLLKKEHPDVKKIEQSIIDFIILLKKNKKYSAIHNYFFAITGFYKINDIVLNVNKISRFMPEKKKSNKDKAYKHEEILQLLNVSDERMKVVILLLSSTGMRIGAIPGLRLRNLERVEIEDSTPIYKITVYENDKEEHFTYCTIECAKAIDNYLAMRKRYGEKFFPNSYLIRDQFDIRNPFAISKCQKTLSSTLASKLVGIAIRSGVRKKQTLDLEEIKKHLGSSYRKEVAICHGFRKFFTTELINKKVNPEIREMLLGHTIGLAGVYYKPTDDDFLEEYERVIDNLTIDPTNRLQRTIEVLKVDKSRIDELEAKIQKLEKRHR